MFEIFHLASEVKDQKQKVAYLTKRLCRKEIVLISIIASELLRLKFLNLDSEVKFDLGGQSSLRTKVDYLS